MRLNTLTPLAIVIILAHLLGGCAGELDLDRAGTKIHVQLTQLPNAADNR